MRLAIPDAEHGTPDCASGVQGSACLGPGGLTAGQRNSLAAACARHGVVLCYLFGSRSSGHADAESDWDVGVVFSVRHSAAERTRRWLALLEALEGAFPAGRVDLVFLQDVPPGLQFEAIAGILLYARDDASRANFEEDVMRRWMDLRPFIEAQERDEEEAIVRGYFFVEPKAPSGADRPDPRVAAAARRTRIPPPG